MEVEQEVEKKSEKKEESSKKEKDVDAPLEKQYIMDVDDDKDGGDDSVNDPQATSSMKEQVDVIVAETESSGNLIDGIERLLGIEKKQRQSEEEGNTIYIAKQIILICYNRKDYTLLAEQISVLCKRRSQFRRVQIRIVQQAMDWLSEMPKEQQLKLIDSLIAVTEGKIFVEVERARLTRKLAQIKEDEGNIAEAAEILQELQIETFGSMRKREKAEFLLEQVRLCMAKRDFIRAAIIRNKITRKIISELKDLEVKYWNLSLMLFYNKDRNFLELGKSYQRLKELEESKDSKLDALSNCVFAIVLAPYGNEQNDLLHRLLASEKKLLESLPVFRELLVLLTTWELISWPLPPKLGSALTSFKLKGVNDSEQNFTDLLRDRVVEHNIRVCAKYYNRISGKRLAYFLGVSVEEMEKYLSKAVTDKMVFARIDRLDGIIRFTEEQTSNAILNDWRSNIDSLLELVDKTVHQIEKEQVIRASGKGKGKKGKKKDKKYVD